MTTKRADRADLVRLTSELVAIRSDSGAAGREREIGRFLVEWFGARGVAAELVPAVGDRPNVIARVGSDVGPTLLLNGHLDTVPAGEMSDAFSPRIDGGALWGRGACDMKGALAAMAWTLVALAGAKPSLRGNVVFAGTVDEETGSLGVKALVDAGVLADYAVVGEPTNLRVTVAHKGACFVRVALLGRGAHGSCPEKGVSTASYGARILTALEDDLRPRLALRRHPLLGTSTVSVGRICGGTEPNIVAERCELDIDRRTLPGEADAVAEVRAIVAGICDGVDGLAYEVFETERTVAVPHVPLGTPPDSRLARAAATACRELGLEGDPLGVTYWTDGGHLAAHGTETIILGPGDIALAHGPNEHVPIVELERAASIYLRIAEALLKS